MIYKKIRLNFFNRKCFTKFKKIVSKIFLRITIVYLEINFTITQKIIDLTFIKKNMCISKIIFFQQKMLNQIKHMINLITLIYYNK